jgi:hypothetical protein
MLYDAATVLCGAVLRDALPMLCECSEREKRTNVDAREFSASAADDERTLEACFL